MPARGFDIDTPHGRLRVLRVTQDIYISPLEPAGTMAVQDCAWLNDEPVTLDRCDELLAEARAAGYEPRPLPAGRALEAAAAGGEVHIYSGGPGGEPCECGRAEPHLAGPGCGEGVIAVIDPALRQLGRERATSAGPAAAGGGGGPGSAVGGGGPGSAVGGGAGQIAWGRSGYLAARWGGQALPDPRWVGYRDLLTVHNRFCPTVLVAGQTHCGQCGWVCGLPASAIPEDWHSPGPPCPDEHELTAGGARCARCGHWLTALASDGTYCLVVVTGTVRADAVVYHADGQARRRYHEYLATRDNPLAWRWAAWRWAGQPDGSVLTAEQTAQLAEAGRRHAEGGSMPDPGWAAGGGWPDQFPQDQAGWVTEAWNMRQAEAEAWNMRQGEAAGDVAQRRAELEHAYECGEDPEQVRAHQARRPARLDALPKGTPLTVAGGPGTCYEAWRHVDLGVWIARAGEPTEDLSAEVMTAGQLRAMLAGRDTPR